MEIPHNEPERESINIQQAPEEDAPDTTKRVMWMLNELDQIQLQDGDTPKGMIGTYRLLKTILKNVYGLAEEKKLFTTTSTIQQEYEITEQMYQQILKQICIRPKPDRINFPPGFNSQLTRFEIEIRKLTQKVLPRK